MSRRAAIIERITNVASTLDSFRDELVFVGGSIVPILVTDSGAHDARVTTDVDVVIEVTSRTEYELVSAKLAKRGFRLDMMDEVMCRFKKADLCLDVMPTKENILKFGNQWYEQAFDTPLKISLNHGIEIKVLNAPLFICTKIEAYKNRGAKDRKDLEDIVAVLDGRPMLPSEIKEASVGVRQFISSEFESLVSLPDLEWYLPDDPSADGRFSILQKRMHQIINFSP